jgi:NhaP-type Na+/H+ or K+/H+ antiporter
MNGFKVTHHTHFWYALAVLIADVIFFSSINASQIAPFVLIIGFALLLLTCYIFIYVLLSIARLYGLPIRYKQRLALYLSGVIGLVVALQSIGELTPRDILVLLPLATLGYMYAVYTTARKRNLDS